MDITTNYTSNILTIMFSEEEKKYINNIPIQL